MVINYNKLSQGCIILLLGMIYADYQNYTDVKTCKDARKLYKAYKTGLKHLTTDNRLYFDPLAVFPQYFSDADRTEAEEIFWSTF